VHLALIAVQLMFASLAIAAKIALRGVPPFGLVAIRTASAALVLLLARALVGKWQRVAWRDLPTLALYALFGITANQLLFIAGLTRTTATDAVVLGTSIPVFTVAVAVALGREQASQRAVVGLGVALLGALVVLGADRFSAASLTGDLLILGNSLSFAIYLVISRGLRRRYSALTVTTWTLAFGALGVLPFGAADALHAAPSMSPATWSAIAYIVTFPTVGSYLLNSWALAHAPSTLVAIYIYLQPVVAALLAALLLGERPQPSTFAGAGLIGAGIWLVTYSPRRSSAPPP
jgi:drug/metabolite transporter (DMT)-like permease